MSKAFSGILLILACVLLQSCGDGVDVAVESALPARIEPDYTGVTVPPNIAPLNFTIIGREPGRELAAKFSNGRDSIAIKANSQGDIAIPGNVWSKLIARRSADSIMVKVCEMTDGGWLSYQPFPIYVSADSIDYSIVYRKLPPLYGTWFNIGVYQRPLAGFRETTIYRNDAYHGNCINCHSVCNRDPQKMLFHLRADGAATYLRNGSQRIKLDTKTDSTVSNFTYPYWHPSGRYVAFSVNNIFQVFHTSDPNRVEVVDGVSDIVVYDVERNETFTSPLLKGDSNLETFPAFSPDGRTLYFCSAERLAAIPEQYRDIRYNLCSISFDPSTGRFGDKVDTLYNAKALGGSMSLPRPSPDGRWLMATLADYGNFHIWHNSADLWLCDLATGEWKPIDEFNSDDVESYHSWSGNSRWVVFSSRRDDGLYTRPYIGHITDGNASKPFLLPQQCPRKFYADEDCSFNIPEFVNAEIDMNTREIVDWIGDYSVKVEYRGAKR